MVMRRRLSTILLLLLFSWLAIGISGCGSGGSSSGGSANVSPTAKATVRFVFKLAQYKLDEVPQSVKTFVFTGFDSSEKVLYGPVNRDKDEVTVEGQSQTITLTDVPVNVTVMEIAYLNSEGQVIAKSTQSGLQLSVSQNTSVEVSDIASVEGASLVVDFLLSEELPATAKQYIVRCEDSNGNIAKSSSLMAVSEMERCVFTDVPLSTSKLKVIFYDAKGEEVATSGYVWCESLEAGHTSYYTIISLSEPSSATYSTGYVVFNFDLNSSGGVPESTTAYVFNFYNKAGTLVKGPEQVSKSVLTSQGQSQNVKVEVPTSVTRAEICYVDSNYNVLATSIATGISVTETGATFVEVGQSVTVDQGALVVKFALSSLPTGVTSWRIRVLDTHEAELYSSSGKYSINELSHRVIGEVPLSSAKVEIQWFRNLDVVAKSSVNISPKSGSTTTATIKEWSACEYLATLNLDFTSIISSSSLPSNVVAYNFIAYDASDKAVYGPDKQSKQATIALKVPASVNKVVIDYLTSSNVAVVRSTIENLSLQVGQAYAIDISSSAPLSGATVVVKDALTKALPANVDHWKVVAYVGNRECSSSAEKSITNRSDIVLSNLPTNTNKLVVSYYRTDNVELAQYSATVTGLAIGQSKNVSISDYVVTFKAKWLFINYMALDNNTISWMLDIFTELQKVGSTNNVELATFLDVSDESKNEYLKSTNPWYNKIDWQGGRLYHMTQSQAAHEIDSQLIKNYATASQPTTNSGSTETLQTVISDALRAFPAEKVCLLLNNHGDSYGGVCDDEHPGSFMTLPGIRKAIEGSLPSTGLDILAFNACLMGNFESMYELHNCTSYVVASADVSYDRGFNYNDTDTGSIFGANSNSTQPGNEALPLSLVIETLQSDSQSGDKTNLVAPNMTAEDVAKLMISANRLVSSSTEILRDLTCVAVDTKKLPAIAEDLKSLALAISADSTQEKAFASAVTNTTELDTGAVDASSNYSNTSWAYGALYGIVYWDFNETTKVAKSLPYPSYCYDLNVLAEEIAKVSSASTSVKNIATDITNKMAQLLPEGAGGTPSAYYYCITEPGEYNMITIKDKTVLKAPLYHYNSRERSISLCVPAQVYKDEGYDWKTGYYGTAYSALKFNIDYPEWVNVVYNIK